MRIPSGTTDQYIYFVAVDATDFTTRETGLSSFTVYRSRNGGAAAAMTTPTINEVDATNMPGVYELLLDEDMTIGSGNDSEEMVFHITHAGMAPVTRTIELYRPKITVGNTLGVESDGDLTKVNTLDGHTAQTGDNYARLGAPAGASVSADIAAIEAQTDDIGAAGAGLTAVPWNAAWDAEVQSEVSDALNAYDPPTKAELDSGLAALNDLSAAEVNAEVDTALSDIHLDHLLAADYDPAAKPGTATALLNELVENDGGVSRFTTNALEQAPSGSGASAEAIADAVWDEAKADHTAAGSFGEEVQAHALSSEITTPPTAAAIADQVWDEATADHTSAGSMGKALQDIPGASPGSNEVTDITIDDGGNPVEGAAVWITTDSAGTNTVWSGTTNASGKPKDSSDKNPFLDAGTYYIWAQLGGYTFSNPTSHTVS